MNNAPVLIVDVDPDDRELLHDAWYGLGLPNALVFLSNGDEVLQYLRSGNIPFLILCDVNIPRIDGFELKKRILEDSEMNYKSIPFVYWSDEASKAQIQKAYDLGGNGFMWFTLCMPAPKPTVSISPGKPPTGWAPVH